MTQWIENQSHMGRVYKIDRKTAAKWMQSDTFPPVDKRSGKWPRDKVAAWVDQHRAEMEERLSGSGDRQEKLQLECEKLRVVIMREREKLKLDEIETLKARELLIDREDHLREMEAHADIVLQELSTFEQVVTSEVREPEAVKAASRCVRNVRTKLAAAIREAGE